jgi:feruloyl esterase
MGSCETLVHLATLPHVTIVEARLVSATAPARGGLAEPGYCKVLGVSRPTADSEIRFEVAMPAGTAWSGRYRQVGNGGFAGRIREDEILEALADGDAAASTDDGHDSQVGTDASWALGHPEKLIDYAWRALKETTDAARVVIRLYEGRAPSHSYFIGCSGGGREALMEAQRYPDDFDGIVAGAPANDFVHLMTGMAWTVIALARTSIPAAKLPAIQAAALRACAAEDSVIEDPLACRFDPAVLRCTSADREDCLNDAQIEALRAIYRGPLDPRTGATLFPGFEPGVESEPGSWDDWIVGSSRGARGRAVQARFAESFFRYMVFGDPSYDLARLRFDEDVATADARVAPILDASSPDLAAFARHGGKLIHWHGWADPVIPPRDSIDYYRRVEAKSGDPRAFYRLFMAPGMLHCYGGPGPNVIAAREAIVDWVEHGTPPSRLIATKFTDDDPKKPVLRTRPLCPYPQRAIWDGNGNRQQARSFVCCPSTDAACAPHPKP